MRRIGLRSSPHGWIGVAVFILIVSALTFATTAPASATRPLTVSLTFDDGRADQMTAQQLLKNHGMVGTFYINSSNIDVPGGHMTRGDLETLKANGNEIAGHSANHLSLSSLSADEAERQICTDRNTLLSWGYAVTSFAYPYSDFNQSVKSTVQACGYNTARTVGNLWSPRGCTDCPAAEPTPPSDLYATGTAADVEETWTLEDLQNTVTRAETNGGWLTFVFHSVCDGCDQYSIRPSVLDEFLTWLQTRSRDQRQDRPAGRDRQREATRGTHTAEAAGRPRCQYRPQCIARNSVVGEREGAPVLRFGRIRGQQRDLRPG